MPVEATSNLAAPLAVARTMLANTAMWRSVCEVETAESALEFTHLIGLPLPDPDNDQGADSIVDHRPFAIVMPPSDDVFMIRRDSVGDGGQQGGVTAGSLMINLEIAVDGPQVEQISDPTVTFLNQLGDICTQFFELSNTEIGDEGMLYVRRVTVEAVGRARVSQTQDLGDYHGAIIRVDWGLA